MGDEVGYVEKCCIYDFRYKKTALKPLEYLMADGVRFELTEDANPRRFSRPLHSTALPSIRIGCAHIIPIFLHCASLKLQHFAKKYAAGAQMPYLSQLLMH